MTRRNENNTTSLDLRIGFVSNTRKRTFSAILTLMKFCAVSDLAEEEGVQHFVRAEGEVAVRRISKTPSPVYSAAAEEVAVNMPICRKKVRMLNIIYQYH